MGMFDDLIQKYSKDAVSSPATGGQNPPAGMFDDLIQKYNNQTQEKSSVPADIAYSAASGVGRGVAGIAGLPGDLAQGSKQLGRYMGFEPPQRSAMDHIAGYFGADRVPTSQDIVNKASEMGLPLADYQPQTTAGRYARSAAEMVPGAIIGPGSIAGNAIRYGVVPGLAAEAAGQATQGSSLEPYARAGAAVAAGGVGALTERRNVNEIISRAAQGAGPDDLARAEALMQRAQASGVPLTRAEALQQVTNGATAMGDVQRVVEGQGQLRPFMSQRPEQVRQAVQGQLDNIAPANAQPSTIGPEIGRMAQGEIDAVRRGINDTTRPLYDQLGNYQIPASDFNRLASDPIVANTLQEVRRNPELGRTVQGLADSDPRVFDLVQRRLGEQADAAMSPANPSTSRIMQANNLNARQGVIDTVDAATGSRPGVPGVYEQARTQQEALRSQYLAPIENGPLGRLAKRDITTRQAIDALFPKNPVSGTEQETLDAVARLSASNPSAARQLVRAKIEQTFQTATKDLQGSENQFGGAGFRKALIGQQQEAANMAAALSGLPGGDRLLQGFDHMMEIMQATGRRQQIGSQTAFNQEMLSELKKGSVAGETVSTGGIKLAGRIQQAYQDWNMGKNTDQLARLLTDPRASDEFRRLAEAPRGSARAISAATRLGIMANTQYNRKGRKE